jgi:hypothetical protein
MSTACMAPRSATLMAGRPRIVTPYRAARTLAGKRAMRRTVRQIAAARAVCGNNNPTAPAISRSSVIVTRMQGAGSAVYPYFNPRATQARRVKVICSRWKQSFNPRAHAGRDTAPSPTPCRSIAVSIHAPTRGATGWAEGFVAVFVVSIHAPTRGATLSVAAISPS